MRPVIIVVDKSSELENHFKTIKSTSKQQFDALFAHSESELLDHLAENDVDIIFFNLNHSDFNFKKAVARIKADYISHHISIIFITDEEDTEILADYIELGAVDFVNYPIIESELLARLKTHLKLSELQKSLRAERDKLRAIVNSVLPQEVSKKLEDDNIQTPSTIDDVIIMFTDFEHYTTITNRFGSQYSFDQLQNIFTDFDVIIHHFGLDCTKTIGDSYMISGGVHHKLDYPELRGLMAGLKIQKYLYLYNKHFGNGLWAARIGMHKGPVLAGFTRTKKINFDLWGNTVNLASRLESVGVSNGVTINDELQSTLSKFCHMTFKEERLLDSWGRQGIFICEEMNLENCPQNLVELYNSLNVEEMLHI